MTTSAFERLPTYLRRYTTTQPADRYTAADHAAWRYIMRQSRAYFREHAVPIYLDGLAKTGITLDRIPMIHDMDRKLGELGWGAVPVEGFIPPAAFLDFQARRVLPIAFDMRSIDHSHYTPAPDIVHEAAGHAPILADQEYADYVTMYAAMAQKAIFAKHDLDVYEAIRTLSDVKESPDSTPAMIDEAERRLVEANAACRFVSEAARVARMNWWTVEYGLLGSLKAPKIYGAGLLSSVGESQTCLSDKVRKIRLTTDCVNQAYDITEPQPQLFVAEDISHLTAVLKEYEQQLAFRRGGVHGLQEAKTCQTVTTVVLGSGVEMSGVLTDFEVLDGRIDFVKLQGPSQLCVDGKQLPGQGLDQHAHGFSTPVGRFKGAEDKDPSRLDDMALLALGIAPGKACELRFASGFVVRGRVLQVQRGADKRLLVIKWTDCTATRGDKIYFQPEWGEFDMAVGDGVVSVYGGPADREAYGSYDVGQATTTPGRRSPYTEAEKAVFTRYQEVRDARAQRTVDKVRIIAERAARDMPAQWLLRLECLEALKQQAPASLAPFVREYEAALLADAERLGSDARWLVKQGVALATVPD
jgi:phenylalanine-4-hydroxylase